MMIRVGEGFELELMGGLLPEGVFLKLGRWEKYISRDGLRVTVN